MESALELINVQRKILKKCSDKSAGRGSEHIMQVPLERSTTTLSVTFLGGNLHKSVVLSDLYLLCEADTFDYYTPHVHVAGLKYICAENACGSR